MTPEDFITRWQRSGGAELANSQSFLKELCQLVGVSEPEPTQADESRNTYVFETAVNLNIRGHDIGDRASRPVRAEDFRSGIQTGADPRANQLAEALATVTQQTRYTEGTALRGTAQWTEPAQEHSLARERRPA